MSTSSYKCYKSTGMLLSNIRYMKDNLFTIPVEYADCFTGYFVLSWRKAYFREVFSRSHVGTLERCGMRFQVVFHRCSVADINKLPNSAKLILSFRTPATDALPPTVLVAIKEGDGS